MTENTSATNDVASEHPGIELSRVLADRGIADSTVADQGGLSRPLMSQITNGNRRITANSATKICRVIGGDPMYWVKRQREHDLYLETQKVTSAMQESSRADVAGH